MADMTTVMEPSDRPAALLWLALSIAFIVGTYWLLAAMAAIYRERPVVTKDKHGHYRVHRDLRQRR